MKALMQAIPSPWTGGSEFTLSSIGSQAGIKAAADQQGGAKGLVQSKAEGQNYIRFGVCTAQIATNTLANIDSLIRLFTPNVPHLVLYKTE